MQQKKVVNVSFCSFSVMVVLKRVVKKKLCMLLMVGLKQFQRNEFWKIWMTKMALLSKENLGLYSFSHVGEVSGSIVCVNLSKDVNKSEHEIEVDEFFDISLLSSPCSPYTGDLWGLESHILNVIVSFDEHQCFQ